MLVDKTSLLIGIIFLTAAQAGAWFQLSGQFIWEWCKKHELFMIIVPSIPISFLYVYSAKYIIKSFNGVMWPSRFISFGVGTVVFAFLVYLLNNEGITAKTAVSLVLAFLLIIIQVLWK